MKAKLAWRLGGASVGAVLVALSLNGIAQAVTDTIFTYKTPRTGYLSLSPTAFMPATQTVATTSAYSASSINTQVNANGGCFTTGVNLPHGAKMTAFAVWYTSDGAGEVEATLLRSALGFAGLDQIAALTSTNAASVRRSMNVATTAAVSVVDNRLYTYEARFCLQSSNDLFHGARIAYTYAHAGD